MPARTAIFVGLTLAISLIAMGVVAISLAFVLVPGCDEAQTEPRAASSTQTGKLDRRTARASAETFHIEGDLALAEFAGLAGTIGGEGVIHLFWKRPAYPVAAYRVYTAARAGGQDFSRPAAEMVPAAAGGDYEVLTLDRLALGTTLYSIVRAIDAIGKEDSNRVEWGASSNPVFRVDPTATEDSTDRPRTYATIEAAVSEAIALDGSNIYVTANTLRERVYLFDGMHLYGGFESTFDPVARMVSGSRTRLLGQAKLDTIVVAPGDLLCGIDGFELVGQLEPNPATESSRTTSERGRRGLVAEDCNLQAAHLFVHGFQDKGVELRSGDDLDDEFEGHLYECEIAENTGEGLALSGVFDLTLRDCILRDNEEEGIEIEPLLFSSQEKSSIKVDRCVVRGNRDLGLNLTLTAHPLQPAGAGGRVRIRLSRSIFESNHDHGASIDVQADASDDVDLRMTVEKCRFDSNQASGLEIDADIRGNYRVTECAFSKNLGSAVAVSGDAPLALIRIHGSSFEEHGIDVETRSPVTVLITNSQLVLPGRTEAGPGTIVNGNDNLVLDLSRRAPDEDPATSRVEQAVTWIDPPPAQPVGREGWRLKLRDMEGARPDIRIQVDGRRVPFQARVEDKTLVVVPTQALDQFDATHCALIISTVELAQANSMEYSLSYPIQPASTVGLATPGRQELRFDRNGQKKTVVIADPSRMRELRLQWDTGPGGRLITSPARDEDPIALESASWRDLPVSTDDSDPLSIELHVEHIPEASLPFRLILSTRRN